MHARHTHCIELLQARRIDQLETRLRLLFKHEAEALSGYVQYLVTVTADTAGARDALYIRCFDPVSLSHYSLKLPENLNGQKGGLNLTKLAPGQVTAAVLQCNYNHQSHCSSCTIWLSAAPILWRKKKSCYCDG
jgi:hypothetical protein